jgi:hypothetical protein
MQKIAAYLLERRDGMTSPEARSSEVDVLKGRVVEWLKSKGSSEIGVTGTYQAEDNSLATFAIDEAVDDGQTWWMIRLEELSDDGRRFAAAISVTDTTDRVVLYATLEAGTDATLINPLEVDPKCPRIVRTLLEAPGRWYHSTSELRLMRHMHTFDEGEGLAAEISDSSRTVPIVAVSQDEEGLVLPYLHEKLAYDLAGLANVVLLDPDATWALTDRLGRIFSCYRGAVRLYWPRLSNSDDPYRHPLWTAYRLRSSVADPKETLKRFRRQLRGRIMRAAALSVVRPREIDTIRNAATRRHLAEMKERASSLQDYRDFAEMYAEENERLREKIVSLQAKAEQLQMQTIELEDAREALLARLENAEVQLRYRRPEAAQEIAPDSVDEPQNGPVADPLEGEERFYKKVYSGPSHDVLERVADCGCNNWQGAHGADKAKKGIARLENGRNDWKKIQHCGSCTGGGMWKVRW